jgi:hypothetical protein
LQQFFTQNRRRSFACVVVCGLLSVAAIPGIVVASADAHSSHQSFTRFRPFPHRAKALPGGDGGVTTQEAVMTTIEQVVDRVRAEYQEMPDLQLKAAQVERLCGIERQVCKVVLDTLLEAKFLYVKPDGHYARTSEGYVGAGSRYPKAS